MPQESSRGICRKRLAIRNYLAACAAWLLFLPGGCPPPAADPDPDPEPNLDALDAGEGLPGENDFFFDSNGDGIAEEFDTGFVFQNPDDYANDPVAPPPDDSRSQPTELPDRVDLSAELPPVGNQGALSSCAAWTAGYALATWNANKVRASGLGSAAVQASPAFLYALTIAKQGSNCDSGTQGDTGLNLLISEGCSSLATVPYDSNNCIDSPSADGADAFKIGSFGRLENPKDRETLKRHLAAGRPVEVGVQTANNFSAYEGGQYVAGGGDSSGQHSGHAMVMVGYDDVRGAYKIMNSWGTSWGEAGFVFWEYADYEQATDEAYVVYSTAAPGGGTERVRENAAAGSAKATISVEQRRASQGANYLVFTLGLDFPIRIDSITCVDPSGVAVESDYGDNWFAAGHVSFVHPDGQPWLPGAYALTLRGTQRDGASAEFHTLGHLLGTAADAAKSSVAGAGFGPGVLGTNLRLVRIAGE